VCGVTAREQWGLDSSDVLVLLADLARAGVSLRVVGPTNLEVRAPRGRLTADLQARIAGLKPELLDRLGPTAPVSTPAVLEEIRPDPAGLRAPFPPSDLQTSFLIGSREGLDLHVRPHQYLEFDYAELDVERFQQAVDRAVRRQRNNIVVIDDEMMLRVVGEPGRVEVGVSDWMGHPDPDEVDAINDLRAMMQRSELPLNTWPWLQLHISRYGDGRARLHYNNNNFFSDALGTLKFLESVFHYYDRPDLPLPELEISYRDCVLALARLEESPRGQAARRYWTERLADLPDAPPVPLAPGANTRERSRLTRRHFELGPADWKAFQRRAAQHGLTPSNAVCGAYAEVLSYWSGSDHFLLNNMITHRLPLHPQVGEVVGNFASLYPLEVRWQKSENFAERTRRLQTQVLADVDQTSWSGVKVLQHLNQVRRSPGRAVCPFAIGSALASEPIDRPVHSLLETPQVLLDCELFHLRDGSLWVVWDAIETLFPPGLLDDMHRAFRHLLGRLASEDGAWTEVAVELMPAAQQEQRILLNRPARTVPAGLLHDALAQRAAVADDSPAVVAGGTRLDHGELHRRADRLAGRLTAAGVGAGDLVAVALPKGWEQPVAVHAVLRAGAAYVPVDSSWPAERIRYVLRDTAARAVVTDEGHVAALSEATAAPVLAATADDTDPEAALPRPVRQRPDDLAYVIYTSGSTGRPKGAMLDHRGPLNTILDINRRFGVGPTDRILGISSLCFDLSVYDVFGAVAAGATLVIPTDEERDPSSWLDLLTSESVTVWNSVPALMQLLVEEAESAGVRLPELRLVLLSGDWIPVALPDRIRRVAPNARVVSLGGATEASIWSIVHPVEGVHPAWTSIPYGRPLSDQSWHVLDTFGRDAPTWVTAELYIGGVGLAQGYLNDPERTEAAFVRHPRTGERLYRTGDIGRYLPSGDLEFLGRADHQVKIQGFRVEPGEIEHSLAEHPLVRHAVVVVRDTGSGKQLTGFVVATRPDAGLDGDSLRSFLAARLPAYLVPDAVVVLDDLPLNANGKVDRAALSALAVVGSRRAMDHTPPHTATEAAVAEVWEEILDVHPIGAHDDFFDAGGQSFAALRVAAALGRRLGRRVPLGLLLEHRTVAAVAAVLDSTRPVATPLVRLGGPPDDPAPLLLVHPAGGGVLAYRSLPARLGRRCLALQAGEEPGASPAGVPVIAQRYLRAIEEAGEPLPRLLAGWSSGAVIAYEMATQLERRGMPIDGLLVLDSPAPVQPRRVDDVTVLLWFLEDLDLGVDLAGLPATAVDRLAATPEPDRLGAALALLAQLDPSGPDLDPGSLAPTFETFRGVVSACNAYQPGGLAADVAVVRATDGVVAEFADHPYGDRPDWGWSTLTRGETFCGSASGSHHTLLTPREPDALATTLDDLLRRLGADRASTRTRGGCPR
jgi:pyochelin synthetase